MTPAIRPQDCKHFQYDHILTLYIKITYRTQFDSIWACSSSHVTPTLHSAGGLLSLDIHIFDWKYCHQSKQEQFFFTTFWMCFQLDAYI